MSLKKIGFGTRNLFFLSKGAMYLMRSFHRSIGSGTSPSGGRASISCRSWKLHKARYKALQVCHSHRAFHRKYFRYYQVAPVTNTGEPHQAYNMDIQNLSCLNFRAVFVLNLRSGNPGLLKPCGKYDYWISVSGYQRRQSSTKSWRIVCSTKQSKKVTLQVL